MQYLPVVYSKNGYVDEPQYHVIRKMPVFLKFDTLTKNPSGKFSFSATFTNNKALLT